MSDTHRMLSARRCQYENPNLPKYIVPYDEAIQVEIELNQCRRELAAAKAEAEKWERLHDADTAHLVSEQQRDNYGPTETLNETAIRLSRERIDCCMEAERVIRELKREEALHEYQLNQWKTLQTWGGTPQIVDEFIKGQQTRIHAAQDAEKQRDMLAEAMTEYMDHHMRYGFVTAVIIHRVEQALAAVKAEIAGNTLTWKPTSDLVTTFDDNSFSIKEGTRIYAVRLSTGFYDIFLAYVDDEGDFCHLSGDTVGWRWDNAELYLDIELPKLPTTKGGQS